MNYLRGALTAASQYYKDLPPINPSTLTGAIDVIVIERPSQNGETELACTPFHVRFGKWQVLRPADKKVNVLVNGRQIPFSMKIGEAGEAFFVFETDEDVPDELVTSPLLNPTDPTKPVVNELPTTGRFGAVEDKIGTEEQPSRPSYTNNTGQEPEFLDLNATQSSESTVTSITSKASDLESSAAHAIRPEKGQLKNLATPMPPTTMSMPNLNVLGPDGSTSKLNPSDDDVLFPMDQQQGQAPDVTYHRDVVLDLSGYHSREASGRTITASDDWSKDDRPQDSDDIDTLTPETSRTPSPVSSPDTSDTSRRSPVRATSEPPEFGSSSPLPEYSWDWGSFPQRSPAKEKFPDLDLSQDNGPSSYDTTPVESKPASPPSRSRSPIPEADNGTLEEDLGDEYRIWLDFEGQRLAFELSLCGDDIRESGSFEAAKQFEEKRISYQHLIDDPQMVESSNLVVRWDDDYIFRSDGSPLMPALVNWRKRTLSSSSSERPLEERNLPRPMARSSTWYRWWSRSKTSTNKSSIPSDFPSGMPSDRPSIEHRQSAPVGTYSGPSETSSLPFPSYPLPVSKPGKKFAKTLRLTSDQLKALGLKKGANSITFSLSASGQVACTARIFLWDSSDHLVVSDIDGTITKSDALGHVFTMIGRDWTHLGVAKLYTDICRNGYKIMYLTSRAIGQADSTRDYLKGIKQNNYQLPEGPVIMSPDRLLTSLHREVIMRKPEVFKMACLRDIQRLFNKPSHNPFYAGFGNRITDALSYRSVDIPSGRIFTIDSTGEVKMELLELAGYKSSYIHMTDIVDQMFPPVHRKFAPEYTDFNFWRCPLPQFDLPEEITRPPSPALTARSDNSSTLSRLRNFSLGRSSRTQSPEGRLSYSSIQNGANLGHVRSAKSLDRLGSPILIGEGIEHNYIRGNDDSLIFVPNGVQGDHIRPRQKPESMPGSLDMSGMQDLRWETDQYEDEDGEAAEGDSDAEEAEDVEEADNAAFDDDLQLAAGEMENVPYL